MPTASRNANASGDPSPIRSAGRPPRTFSLSNLISDFVHGSSSSSASDQKKGLSQPQQAIRRLWSAGDVEGMTRCPYSAVMKNPHVPFEFQMPVHYPRFTKEQYEKMPEWQLDRLLEEYGLPAQEMGSLNDKRQYAIGAFLWKSSL